MKNHTKMFLICDAAYKTPHGTKSLCVIIKVDLASTCINLLLHSKPVQQNYRHFFKEFKPKSAF